MAYFTTPELTKNIHLMFFSTPQSSGNKFGVGKFSNMLNGVTPSFVLSLMHVGIRKTNSPASSRLAYFTKQMVQAFLRRLQSQGRRRFPLRSGASVSAFKLSLGPCSGLALGWDEAGGGGGDLVADP